MSEDHMTKYKTKIILLNQSLWVSFPTLDEQLKFVNAFYGRNSRDYKSVEKFTVLSNECTIGYIDIDLSSIIAIIR